MVAGQLGSEVKSLSAELVFSLREVFRLKMTESRGLREGISINFSLSPGDTNPGVHGT